MARELVAQTCWDSLQTGGLRGLKELSLSAYNLDVSFDALAAFADALRQAPAETVSGLRVLRLEFYITKRGDDPLTAFANGNDGRWDKLQVLDLSGCVLGDKA